MRGSSQEILRPSGSSNATLSPVVMRVGKSSGRSSLRGAWIARYAYAPRGCKFRRSRQAHRAAREHLRMTSWTRSMGGGGNWAAGGRTSAVDLAGWARHHKTARARIQASPADRRMEVRVMMFSLWSQIILDGSGRGKGCRWDQHRFLKKRTRHGNPKPCRVLGIAPSRAKGLVCRLAVWFLSSIQHSKSSIKNSRSSQRLRRSRPRVPRRPRIAARGSGTTVTKPDAELKVAV